MLGALDLFLQTFYMLFDTDVPEDPDLINTVMPSVSHQINWHQLKILKDKEWVF